MYLVMQKLLQADDLFSACHKQQSITYIVPQLAFLVFFPLSSKINRASPILCAIDVIREGGGGVRQPLLMPRLFSVTVRTTPGENTHATAPEAAKCSKRDQPVKHKSGTAKKVIPHGTAPSATGGTSRRKQYPTVANSVTAVSANNQQSTINHTATIVLARGNKRSERSSQY